jgi:hypothetical protein
MCVQHQAKLHQEHWKKLDYTECGPTLRLQPFPLALSSVQVHLQRIHGTAQPQHQPQQKPGSVSQLPSEHSHAKSVPP